MSNLEDNRTVLIRFRVSELEEMLRNNETTPGAPTLRKQQNTTFRRKKPVVRYATQYADGKIPRDKGPWTPAAF